jgi:transcriptional regulator with XRE-family HTH domain
MARSAGRSVVTDDGFGAAAIRMFYEDFGEQVRLARGSLSQAELGRRIGLSRGSVSNIEAGRQRVPLHILPILARALQVDPLDLIALARLPDDVGVPGLAADERRFVAQVIAQAKTKADDDAR